MNSKMFLQLLFALGFVGSSFACRCLPKTQDERFCEGNFAAIIYVEGRDVVGLERVYNIDIIAILRGNMQQADERHLKGATHSCGVTFEVNKYYVISGN
ncbi:hypothetical protein DPMN_014301 [Dreissena polymorpha]|uniref:NTR domain-containing protein n=1 Tax=Dreissena polymorpha TaxID=45954 RepID=A0A9D4N953_DREPO|nr:hypothetical protein DPMN_014301 [Dreissena polymorpha]